MNRLQVLFDMVSKSQIAHDYAPTDLFLAGLIVGGLGKTEANSV